MSDPVLRARTAPEILQALAEALRSKHHPGRDCPPSTIPTPEALAAWLPECPRTIWSNFTTQIDALHFYFAVKPERPTHGITMDDYRAMMEFFTFPHYAAPIRRTGDTLARALLGAHRVWAGIDEDLRGRHPAGLLVDAWQGRAIDTEPERRTKGILAAPFVQRHKQPCLPGMTGRPADALPGLLQQKPSPAYLPGLEPEQREKPALLALFDAAGGASGGRTGAPSELIIFIEALLTVPVPARDGHLYRITSGDGQPFTIREIAGEWLQWKLKHYKPGHKYTGQALKRAMLRLRDLDVPMGNRGFYYPLMLEAVEGWGLNHGIAFLARLPQGSGVGAFTDRNVLRILGKLSEPAYRAYLALCIEWNCYGSHNGRLLLPTRPIAKRDTQGRILDAQGRIITGADGVPVKSPYDRRAILTGDREPNPARNRYPEYWADDLVFLAFRNLAPPGSTRRVQQMRARRAVELIEKVGGCTIERRGSNSNNGLIPWRPMPPHPNSTTSG